MSNSAQSLSLERKIKMHEAREGIINRLAMTLPRAINLDRFLNVIVSELGRMMNVDRCDVIQLKSASELRISHEWRASESVPSSLDARVPVDVKTLSQYLDVRQPIKLDDTSAPELDHKVRFFAKSLGTRSLCGRTRTARLYEKSAREARTGSAQAALLLDRGRSRLPVRTGARG